MNSARRQICARCGKRKPARRKPAHMAVLRTPYEEWVARYGETCGICGRGRSDARRLDRDHDHATGEMRGLLCFRCNRMLASWITEAWLLAAANYLGEHVASKDRTKDNAGP